MNYSGFLKLADHLYFSQNDQKNCSDISDKDGQIPHRYKSCLKQKIDKHFFDK